MIRSMTGFGGGTEQAAGWRVEATVRTLNHRFLSVKIRGLADRPGLLAKAEQYLRAKFGRGEINAWLNLARDRLDADAQLIDADAASDMHQALSRVVSDLGLSDPPTLTDLIRMGALQVVQESDEGLWPPIRAALDAAAEAALASRSAEGEVLSQEIDRILGVLQGALEAIRDRLPEILEAARLRLSERVTELEIAVDAERLEAEIALLVERHDVQEEIARLEGHFGRVNELKAGGGTVGKELDFLSQELLREINTIGSKVRDSVVSGVVIDMKVAVEQLREQVQNVE